MMSGDPIKDAIMKKRQGLSIEIEVKGLDDKKTDLAPPTEESKVATKKNLMEDAVRESPETAEDMGWMDAMKKAFMTKKG